LLRAVARDREQVEIDPAALARLEPGERRVEQRPLLVERGLDIGREAVAVGAALELALAPHAAFLRLAVAARARVLERALAFVDAALEAALVLVAVRQPEAA